jgi:hypothetical protein
MYEKTGASKGVNVFRLDLRNALRALNGRPTDSPTSETMKGMESWWRMFKPDVAVDAESSCECRDENELIKQ